MSASPTTENQDWFKDAIIYQLHVKSFCDSNGDGVGDFRGLASKLDYLQDLGVTGIWLLPFYPSPLRDDGYDIADYTAINPVYGTMSDFRAFLREAHKREIRVITELVINHTSDQHAWFQRARTSPRGSKARDFYVWSDAPELYQDARIIFQDFETSNWTWDPVAAQYFWHRFYGHQPDLNFENPQVRKAIKAALDFWMKLGVDGLRLDAIPYLFEEDGTNCENLPATHDFLKELRRHLDDNYPGRMLLAEANQWPEDAVDYFGDGDECHMSFHFPLMPRLFMAVQSEDRFPVIDILQQTPEIPESCQWAIFLRNHDELTLEMVTDEERDYMYRSYAQDPQMRINLGIRRRLAPLVGGDRNKIQLLNGLLFSMPGTPIVYYGDELGMGDNVYLGDRDGVRTPMQWNSDRNAGFSAANPHKLYLPVIIDPEYHYEYVNVESQQNNPSWLLWWMKRLIGLRKQYDAFGRGTVEFLPSENHRILSYVRRHETQSILIVANLSRFSQSVALELGEFVGSVPLELFGHTEFPRITEPNYSLSLGPHSFYWFLLEATDSSPGSTSIADIPTIAVAGTWRRAIGVGTSRNALAAALPEILPSRRWYGSKSRRIRNVVIDDVIPLGGKTSTASAYVLLATVGFFDGDPETYSIPIKYAADENAARDPSAILARVKSSEGEGLIVDGTQDDTLHATLLDLIRRRKSLRGTKTVLSGRSSAVFQELAGDVAKELPTRLFGGGTK